MTPTQLATVASSLPACSAELLRVAQSELSIAQTMVVNLHRCPDGRLGARVATITAALDTATSAAFALKGTLYAVEGASITTEVLALETALLDALTEAQVPTIVFCRDERALVAALTELDAFGRAGQPTAARQPATLLAVA